MMTARLAAAAVAVLGVFHAQTSEAAVRSCPNCDLDVNNAPHKFVCENGFYVSEVPEFGSRNARVCVQVPNATFACENAESRGTTPSPVTDLHSDSSNCGACGNVCSDDAPLCVNDVCVCGANFPCSSTSKFCDAVVTGPGCVDCPAGTRNCLDGVAGCETNILTDVNNCGECGKQCGTGHTCSNGACVCGSTNAQCKYPTEICSSSGACIECSDPSSDFDKCAKLSLFDTSKFCGTTGTCLECPSGFGDCNTFQLGDVTVDNGTTADCETFLNKTGTNSNCGMCGATCGGGGSAKSQSCCNGQCKCGKFVDNAIPSEGECEAAQTCSTTEYCDAVLGQCLPLNPGNVVCTGNAVVQSAGSLSISLLNSIPFCGSCDRTEALKNIVNNTCFSSSDKCGPLGTECRTGQVCIAQKCHCNPQDSRILSLPFLWTVFLDQDPDRDNKIDFNGMPARGCDNNVLMSLAQGFYMRAMLSLNRLIACIAAGPAPKTSISPADLRNLTFRAEVCAGGEGQCPLAYCDAVIGNLTGFERGDFCGFTRDATADIKRCAQNYIFNGETEGDLTCANVIATTAAQSSPTTFNWLDLYSFLGCEEPHDDLVYHFNFADLGRTFPHRATTAQNLLGSASLAHVSYVIVIAVALAFAFVA